MKMIVIAFMIIVIFFCATNISGKSISEQERTLVKMRLLIDEGDLNNAFAQLTDLINKNESNIKMKKFVAEAFYLKAKILFIAEDENESEILLTQCFEIYPNLDFQTEKDPSFLSLAYEIKMDVNKKIINLNRSENKFGSDFMIKKNHKPWGTKLMSYPVFYVGLTYPDKNSWSSEKKTNYQYGIGYSMDIKDISIELDVLMSSFSSNDNYYLNWKQISIPLIFKYKIMKMKNNSYYYLLAGYYLGVINTIEEYYRGNLIDISEFRNKNISGYSYGFGWGLEKVGFELKVNRSLTGILPIKNGFDFKFNTTEINIFLKFTDKDIF